MRGGMFLLELHVGIDDPGKCDMSPLTRGGECSPRRGFLQIVDLDNVQREKVPSFDTGSTFRGCRNSLRRVL